jgi:hypothetical protein
MAVGPGCFFATEITMLVQRAQRGCDYSVGVQEFWASFAHIAVSFVVLVVKNGRWAGMFFYHRDHHVGAKGTEGL